MNSTIYTLAIDFLILISIVSGTGLNDICFGYNYFTDELSNSLILNCSHTLTNNINIMMDDSTTLVNTQQCEYNNLKFNSNYTSSYTELIQLNNILISSSYNISESTGHRGGGILSSLLPSKHISNTQQTYFHFINFICNIGSISLAKDYNALKFNSTFLNSIAVLPPTFNIEHHSSYDMEAFEYFFNTYGSHMIFNAIFGGKINGFISTNKCKVDIDFRNNQTQFVKCFNNDFLGINDEYIPPENENENVDEYGCPNEFEASKYITNSNLRKLGGSSMTFTSYPSFSVEYDDKKLGFDNFIDSLSIDSSTIISSTHTIPFYDIIPYLHIPSINNQQVMSDIGNAMRNAYMVMVNNTKREMIEDIEDKCEIDECFGGDINERMCKCAHCDGIQCCRFGYVSEDEGGGGGAKPFIDFNDGDELGIFIGVCIGGILLLVFVIVLILCCCKRRNKKRNKEIENVTEVQRKSGNTNDVTLNMTNNDRMSETEGINNSNENEINTTKSDIVNDANSISDKPVEKVNNETTQQVINEEVITDKVAIEQIIDEHINENENESKDGGRNEEIPSENETESPIVADIDSPKTDDEPPNEDNVNNKSIESSIDEYETDIKEVLSHEIPTDNNEAIIVDNTEEPPKRVSNSDEYINENKNKKKEDIPSVNVTVIEDDMNDNKTNEDQIDDKYIDINKNTAEMEDIIDDNNNGPELMDDCNVNTKETNEIIEDNIDGNKNDIQISTVHVETLTVKEDNNVIEESLEKILIAKTPIDDVKINENEKDNMEEVRMDIMADNNSDDIKENEKNEKQNKLKVNAFDGLLRASTERVEKIKVKDLDEKDNGFLSRASTQRVPKIVVKTGKRESLKSRTPTKQLKRGVAVTTNIANKSISDEIRKKGKLLKLQKEEQNAIKKKNEMMEGGNKPHKSHHGQFYD